jgi:hypothetical protein
VAKPSYVPVSDIYLLMQHPKVVSFLMKNFNVLNDLNGELVNGIRRSSMYQSKRPCLLRRDEISATNQETLSGLKQQLKYAGKDGLLKED